MGTPGRLELPRMAVVKPPFPSPTRVSSTTVHGELGTSMKKHTILFLASQPARYRRRRARPTRAADHARLGGERDPAGAQAQRLPAPVRAGNAMGGGAAGSAARARAHGGLLQRPWRSGRAVLLGARWRGAPARQPGDRGDLRCHGRLGQVGRAERFTATSGRFFAIKFLSDRRAYVRLAGVQEEIR